MKEIVFPWDKRYLKGSGLFTSYLKYRKKICECENLLRESLVSALSMAQGSRSKDIALFLLRASYGPEVSKVRWKCVL